MQEKRHRSHVDLSPTFLKSTRSRYHLWYVHHSNSCIGIMLLRSDLCFKV